MWALQVHLVEQFGVVGHVVYCFGLFEDDATVIGTWRPVLPPRFELDEIMQSRKRGRQWDRWNEAAALSLDPLFEV